MDGQAVFPGKVFQSIDGLTRYVEQPAADLFPDRHLDRGTGRAYLHAPVEAVGNVHRDAPNGILADLLLDFQHDLLSGVAGDGQCVVYLGEILGLRRKLYIHHRAYDFDDVSFRFFCSRCHRMVSKIIILANVGNFFHFPFSTGDLTILFFAALVLCGNNFPAVRRPFSSPGKKTDGKDPFSRFSSPEKDQRKKRHGKRAASPA